MKRYLTEAAVRSLKSENTLRVWDTHTRGFGVSVGANAKTWIVRTGEKRTVRKLGRYPAMSLIEARKKAMAALSAEPERVTQNITVEEAFEEYERAHGATHHTARTRYETHRLYCRYVEGQIGHKKLAQLSFSALEQLLPRKPSEANHVFRFLRAFLNWCVRKEYLAANPLVGKSQPAKERSRDRVLSEPEIQRLWDTATRQYGAIWKLLLLTGQRRSQIVGLEWEWVKDDVIEFPARIMKGGKPHIIPIGDFARSLLPERKGKYVFPSSKGGHTVNLQKDKRPHDEKAKVEAYTIHDLRRTVSTIHASIGTPIHIIELLLNHTLGGRSEVAAIYNRYGYLKEMREAVQVYEDHLQSLCSRV